MLKTSSYFLFFRIGKQEQLFVFPFLFLFVITPLPPLLSLPSTIYCRCNPTPIIPIPIVTWHPPSSSPSIFHHHYCCPTPFIVAITRHPLPPPQASLGTLHLHCWCLAHFAGWHCTIIVIIIATQYSLPLSS